MIYCVVDEPDVPEQDMSGAGTMLFQMIASDLFPYMNIYKTNDMDPADVKKVDENVSPTFVEGSPTDDNVAPGAQQNEEDADAEETEKTDEGEDAGDEETGEEGDESGETEEGSDGDAEDPGGGEEAGDGEDTG